MHPLTALVSLLMLTVAASSAPAQSTSVPHELMETTIECLVDGAMARDTLRDLRPSGTALVDSFNEMMAKRSSIRRFQRCRGRVGSITAYSEASATALQGLRLAFDSLIAGFTRSLALDEKLLKMTTGQELRAVIPEASEVSDDIDAAWRLLPVLMGAVSAGMLDESRVSAKGSVNRLRLTRTQISESTTLLHSLFPGAAKQKDGERHVVEASAALLMQFFDQKWVASDEP